jgi:hypothetical protein
MLNNFGGKTMKKCLFMLVVLAIGLSAQAAMVAKYSFSGNLNDTATGGTTADNLVGMRYYPGNGKFDSSVTNYKTDGTTEVLTTGVTNPIYAQGLVGTAVRIGARGAYNYAGTNVYPNASTYQVPAIDAGATYLTSTSDSADLSLGREFTLEGFFKADAVGSLGVQNSGTGELEYARLITKWCSGFTQSYHLTLHYSSLELIELNSAGGAAYVNRSTSPTTGIKSTISADRWFYVAAVADGLDTMSVYFYTTDNSGNVIGGLVANGAYNGTINDGTAPLWIGGRYDVPNAISNNNAFEGLADEVQLWNEAKDGTYFADRAQLLVPEPMTIAILALGGLLIRRK